MRIFYFHEKKNFFTQEKTSELLTQKLLKVTISHKLRIAQNKSFMQKQVNSDLPCKFGHFWIKLNFWASTTPLLEVRGTQTPYDVVWNIVHIIFVAHSLSSISR